MYNLFRKNYEMFQHLRHQPSNQLRKTVNDGHGNETFHCKSFFMATSLRTFEFYQHSHCDGKISSILSAILTKLIAIWHSMSHIDLPAQTCGSMCDLHQQSSTASYPETRLNLVRHNVSVEATLHSAAQINLGHHRAGSLS